MGRSYSDRTPPYAVQRLLYECTYGPASLRSGPSYSVALVVGKKMPRPCARGLIGCLTFDGAQK
jgi:hypothetical protein